MDQEAQALHEQIHVQHRQMLLDVQWELVQAKAQVTVKEARIAELTALLDAATTPGE